MESYVELLRRNVNYRNLWLGAVVSQLGDWFNLIAAASLIAGLTSSGAAISYLFLARFLPLFVFSPLAGVLADRFDRRRIMILSDVLRALIVLGFLFIRDPAHLWLFYLLTASQFALSAVFTPTRTAVIATIVKREDLVTANALDSLTWSTMLAVGSLLGGVVAGMLGDATTFIADSFTFLAAAYFVSRVSIPERIVAARAAGKPVAGEPAGWLNFFDGLRYLLSEPFIFVISLVKAGGSLIWGAVNVLEVSFAEQVFPLGGDGSTTLGIIYAISGLGTGFGPVLLRRWLGDESGRLRWGITIGFWILALGVLGLAAAPTLALFGVATLVRTVGSGTVWVFAAVILQMAVPDRVRGRVFAFEFGLLTLTQSLSVWWAGFAQDSVGWSVQEVTTSAGVAGLVVAVLWTLFHLKTRSRPLERTPQAVAPAAAETRPAATETRHIL